MRSLNSEDPTHAPITHLPKATRRQSRQRRQVNGPPRPEPQLRFGRRFPPDGPAVQHLVPVSALSGSGGTPLPPGGGGIRTAPRVADKITERTRGGGPTRRKQNC